MRRIPNVLLNNNSAAEGRVFRLLEDVDIGADWLALHSLNCSEHAYKHWAEIDFLLAGPDAILVLEVKGGRVQCTDGIWTYTDRFGRSRSSSEGPFGQARSAMYALKELLEHRYRLGSLTSGRACFGFGVVFADIDWDIDGPETPSAITADRSTLTSSKSLARYLKNVTRYWRDKFPNAPRLTSGELRDLRNRLRPDVDLYPPLSQRAGLALQEMQHLTEEQYERLELLEQNDRAIVGGGAGTGKTFLLMQLARRQAALGKSVSVVVHSEVLAAHLRKSLADARIQVYTLASLTAFSATSDLLLVDEGQDLMTFEALEIISGAVSGGLDNGQWCWFLDENNQVGVTGEFDPEAFEYLSSGLSSGKPVRFPLRRNCRNTREIVGKVQLWTGADIGVTEVTGFGASPQLIIVKEGDEPAAAVERLVCKILDEGAAPEDVALLTSEGKTPPFLAALSARLRRLLIPLTVTTVASNLRGRILWGPPSAYKGLERPIVVVCAFDHEGPLSDAGFYVAVTRANYGLWILASPAVAARLARQANEHARSPAMHYHDTVS